mgnify:CR=1 FL=1
MLSRFSFFAILDFIYNYGKKIQNNLIYSHIKNPEFINSGKIDSFR